MNQAGPVAVPSFAILTAFLGTMGKATLSSVNSFSYLIQKTGAESGVVSVTS